MDSSKEKKQSHYSNHYPRIDQSGPLPHPFPEHSPLFFGNLYQLCLCCERPFLSGHLHPQLGVADQESLSDDSVEDSGKLIWDFEEPKCF